jgi:hypothetical protein
VGRIAEVCKFMLKRFHFRTQNELIPVENAMDGLIDLRFKFAVLRLQVQKRYRLHLSLW